MNDEQEPFTFVYSPMTGNEQAEVLALIDAKNKADGDIALLAKLVGDGHVFVDGNRSGKTETMRRVEAILNPKPAVNPTIRPKSKKRRRK